MPKLYELLAVEGPLKSQADKTRTDLKHTFQTKPHLFAEKHITVSPIAEGAGQDVIESQSSLQTDVTRELEWISGIWAKALDGAFAIADANTAARADVVLEDGTVMMTSVPTTALLELEKRATELQELIGAIPTLDPAKDFTLDPAHAGKHIYKARDDVKDRTKKEQQVLVLYPATDKHPAQVQVVSVDVVVAKVKTQEWSGMITPAEKGDMLSRAEQLARAFKAARSRANAHSLDKVTTIGAPLLSFVFTGTKPAGVAK